MNNDHQLYPILLADDDLISRQLCKKILARQGFTVTTAANGREALELFRQRFFPIVLTDWEMPEMEGPELCRAIRDENPDRYVFIVMLTTKGSKEDIISGLSAGADDYLTKPAHYAELVTRIKTGIRILELERSLKAAVDEIHLMSITDSLTGVHNRAYINERLPREIRRAHRYGRDLSIMLCTIDHFKKINDTYGNLAGDTVLKSFAQRLSGAIRQQVDWAGRFSGDKFLLVLPETDLNGAAVFAERLRRELSSSVETSGETIRFTASFGLVGFSPTDGEQTVNSDVLVQKADSLLTRAKSRGPNRIETGLLSR